MKNLGDILNGCTINKKQQIRWERKSLLGRGEIFYGYIILGYVFEVRIESRSENKDIWSHLQISDCWSIKTKEILEVDCEKSGRWKVEYITGDHTGLGDG